MIRGRNMKEKLIPNKGLLVADPGVRDVYGTGRDPVQRKMNALRNEEILH